MTKIIFAVGITIIKIDYSRTVIVYGDILKFTALYIGSGGFNICRINRIGICIN